MPKIDLKQVAQPYVGSKAEMQDFLHPVRTTAQLADISDQINITDKYAGQPVWDSTLGQPVWADGPDPGDTWSLATGVVSTTPS
jgi:hypothetical protein